MSEIQTITKEQDEYLAEQERLAAEEETGSRNPIEANQDASSKKRFAVQQSQTAKGFIQSHIKAPKTAWISNLVYLDGKPFSFNDREYLLQIYNGRFKRKLLKFGRQSEKSTMLANELIINSLVKAYNKAVYVSPSTSQTRQFSSGKLSPWMVDSPHISKYWLSTQTANQVFEKGFTNGSLIWLRSAFLNADRCRGLSGEELMIDEVQDMLTSNIAVIQEILAHAKDSSQVFAGTPLTFANPIEDYWQKSSQCEWLVPCDRHTPVFWNLLGIENIGKHGPICKKCGGAINPKKGRWFAFSSKTDWWGFHISQVQAPWMQSPEKWKELIFKLENYSEGQFINEVIGNSFDSASKPISRGELIALCSSKHPMRFFSDPWTRSQNIYAGIDWGEGSDGKEKGSNGRMKTASYTILTLGCFIAPNVFHVFYSKRYEGSEARPENCVEDIIKTLTEFNVKAAGVDWGHGWGVNSQLEKALPGRIVKFQYVGMQKERRKWDDIGEKFQLGRTEVMTDFFTDLKKQRYVFPEWEVMQHILKDVEHIHAEYGTHGLKYDHRSTEPDDAAHSIIYCREVARLFVEGA